MALLDYAPLQTGRNKKWRFRKDDPQILSDGTLTHFKTFSLPTGNAPLSVKVETSTSFEVPHFPVKYLFCPRIETKDVSALNTTSFSKNDHLIFYGYGTFNAIEKRQFS